MKSVSLKALAVKFFFYFLTLVAIAGSREVAALDSLNTQIVETPKKIVQALDSLYPGPKDVRWSKNWKKYTAHFIFDARNFAVTFDSNGKIETTIEEITNEILPKQVKEKLDRFYKAFKIVMVLQRSKNDDIEYDIEIIRGYEHIILNYNRKGYLIRQYQVTKVDRYIDFSDD